MNELLNLCMGCMRPISKNATICPHCAYNSQIEQPSPFLPKRTVLQNRYIIGRVLSSCSDSATYIGFDTAENKVLSVVEFLPENLIIRQSGKADFTVKSEYTELFSSCLSSFKNLWKAVGEIGNPLAVNLVFDVFEENGTAYAVCQHTEGISLRDYFEERRDVMTWSEAYRSMLPVMTAVSKLHQMGFIHGEISPATVYVTNDGHFRLGGFSVAQSHGTYPEISQLPVGGYASLERYKDPSVLSFSSDVYSLVCIFYTCLTGQTPKNAQNCLTEPPFILPAEIQRRISPLACEVFANASLIFPTSRTSRVEELITAFSCRENIFAENTRPQFKAPSPIQSISSGAVKSTVSQSSAKPKYNLDIDFADGESKKEDKPKEEISNLSSGFSIVLKSFFSVLIILTLVFSTLYTTVLYKSMTIPFYEKVFGSLSFLPMNIDANKGEETTAENQQTTVAPTRESEFVTVADFTALSYEYIKQNAIFAQNYDIVFEFEYSDKFEKNEIIMQSIPAGEDVEIGTTIILYVSRGKETVVLKDVIGMDFDKAEKLLTDDGFEVSKRTLKNDGAQKSNEVYTMSLVAGIEFEKGTKIVLSVWE